MQRDGLVIIPNFRLVEIKVLSTTNPQLFMADDEVLRMSARIIGINIFRVGRLSKTQSGNVLVADGAFNASTLSIVTLDGTEVLNRVPLTDIARGDNSGKTFLVDIPKFLPSKSYVYCNDTTTLALNSSYLLGIYYQAK